MKPWSRFVALFLLALWLPATQHCDLEAAGIDFMTHDGHASSACHDTCVDDACHNIEGAAFTKGGNTLRVLPPPAMILCACLIHVPPPPPAVETPVIDDGTGSRRLLVLHRTWDFVRRAALPARAPDSIA